MKKTFGNFEFEFQQLSGLAVITPKTFSDSRGSFSETFNESAFKSAGLPFNFKQDNYSTSKKGVVRGMHMQTPTAQGKLVRVTKGEVFDVAWDLRKESSTFGLYFGLVLSEENKKMMYVPEGFAHGFLALEDCEFSYKCTETYRPGEELCVLYDSYTIPWLHYARTYDISNFVLSSKDMVGLTFEQYRNMYGP